MCIRDRIKNTVQIYLQKDALGRYRLPLVHQRPIFLLGAPGLGKTAIMQQVADEMGLGLVSYSMTHHTRQSALGLPVIVEKEYGGKHYQVSEYTMSEIIASVYAKMEATGLKEGILFIDEINCVSETLAPTMLQFLQCKTFGNQAVPAGWVMWRLATRRSTTSPSGILTSSPLTACAAWTSSLTCRCGRTTPALRISTAPS